MTREMSLLSTLNSPTRLNILIANTKGETAGPKAKEKVKQQRKQSPSISPFENQQGITIRPSSPSNIHSGSIVFSISTNSNGHTHELPPTELLRILYLVGPPWIPGPRAAAPLAPPQGRA
jgi:hypothetical protein